MNNAMNSVLATLAGEDPKIYLRTTTWHDNQTDPADNRVGFRISTHGVYNNQGQIDYMFDRLVAAVEAAAKANGLTQCYRASGRNHQTWTHGRGRGREGFARIRGEIVFPPNLCYYE